MKSLVSLLIPVVLALGSAPAMAEWTEIGGNDDVVFYADIDSLVASGPTKTMWTMIGSKTERMFGEVKFSSVKTQFEFDCPANKARELQTAFFSGPRADGKQVAGYTEPGDWTEVDEASLKGGLLKIACEAAPASTT
jgi:hypothetical protein